MAPHWKCGSRQRVAGSNPALSATPQLIGRSDVQADFGMTGPGGSPAPDSEEHRDGRTGIWDQLPAYPVGPRRPVPAHVMTRARPPRLLSLPRRARRGTSGALYLQSAPAGLNSLPRSTSSKADASSDVEGRVPRSGVSRTVSGPEGSSTKRSASGAAERPGPSRSLRRARGRPDRRRVHGNCFFFNHTATTEIYTLPLHDALPILAAR